MLSKQHSWAKLDQVLITKYFSFGIPSMKYHHMIIMWTTHLGYLSAKKWNLGSSKWTALLVTTTIAWAVSEKKTSFSSKCCVHTYLVFFYQNYSFLLWEKKCSSDWEKLLKFEAEGWEFAKGLQSLEQSNQTVKGQNDFW